MKPLHLTVLFLTLMYSCATTAGENRWKWITVDLASDESRLTPQPAEVIKQGASTTIILTNQSQPAPTTFACENSDPSIKCTNNDGVRFTGYTRNGVYSKCTLKETAPKKTTSSLVVPTLPDCVALEDPTRSFIVLYRYNTMILVILD